MSSWTRRRFSLSQVVGLLTVVLVAPGLWAWAASVTHTFSNGTTADADEVNQFQDLVGATTELQLEGTARDQAIADLDADRTKLVFVTSTVTTGSFGGSIVADRACNDAAAAAGLPGLFRAWVGQRSVTSPNVDYRAPVNHFTPGKRYVLSDGRPVAYGWADLTDGTLINPIDLDEWGQPVAGKVWTGIQADGRTVPGGSPCQNWSNGASSAGIVGLIGSTGSTWSFNPVYEMCWLDLPFYCFEQ